MCHPLPASRQWKLFTTTFYNNVYFLSSAFRMVFVKPFAFRTLETYFLSSAFEKINIEHVMAAWQYDSSLTVWQQLDSMTAAWQYDTLIMMKYYREFKTHNNQPVNRTHIAHPFKTGSQRLIAVTQDRNKCGVRHHVFHRHQSSWNQPIITE